MSDASLEESAWDYMARWLTPLLPAGQGVIRLDDLGWPGAAKNWQLVSLVKCKLMVETQLNIARIRQRKKTVREVKTLSAGCWYLNGFSGHPPYPGALIFLKSHPCFVLMRFHSWRKLFSGWGALACATGRYLGAFEKGKIWN